MLTKIKQFLVVLYYAWTYRRLIYLCVCDVDDVVRLLQALFAAKNRGKEGCVEGRTALLALLNLKSVSELVLVTETVADDDALANIKEAIQDDKIYTTAWRILVGDWDLVEESRWQSIISRIRSRLPFDEVPCGDSADETEIGVIEIVSVVTMIMTILPKIIKIINNRKEQRKEKTNGV